MIILMVGLVILGLGILMATVGRNWGFEIVSPLPIVIGVIWLVICFFLIMGVETTGKRVVLEYEQDRLYIESLYDEDVISLAERNKVVTLIMKDNNIINKCKVNSDSALYNLFYSEDVGKLELFDVTKITNIKNEIVLEKVK